MLIYGIRQCSVRWQEGKSGRQRGGEVRLTQLGIRRGIRREAPGRTEGLLAERPVLLTCA